MANIADVLKNKFGGSGSSIDDVIKTMETSGGSGSGGAATAPAVEVIPFVYGDYDDKGFVKSGTTYNDRTFYTFDELYAKYEAGTTLLAYMLTDNICNVAAVRYDAGDPSFNVKASFMFTHFRVSSGSATVTNYALNSSDVLSNS